MNPEMWSDNVCIKRFFTKGQFENLDFQPQIVLLNTQCLNYEKMKEQQNDMLTILMFYVL